MKHPTIRAVSLILCGLLALLGDAGPLVAQGTPEQQAEILLNSARKAHNDKNYAFATSKFREFLSKFANNKDAAAARYGLALTLIDGPDKKYDEARDLFQGLAASKEFADRALATYYAGVSIRGLGLNELAQADAKPNDAVQRRAQAQTRFNEAIPFFTNAIPAFLAKVEEATDGKKLTIAAEWVARARCDLAEMQIRVGKFKEAQAGAAPFVADPLWSKSQYRNLGRYYHGYASTLLKDNVAAQKTLAMLAPFDDPTFGNHARYLLARTHHLADERAEASTHYDAAINDYNKAKADAAVLLRQPQKFNNDPAIRARLEALLKNPPPDHVARSIFYVGVLNYEGGKFGDAKTRFAEFVKQFPQSPLLVEAAVRIGYCQVQLKEYMDALKTLGPLVEKDPRLSDQVLFWIARAQSGVAPEASVNPQLHQQAINGAINTLRQAAQRAQNISAQDPDAKVRRGEILLETADQLQRVSQSKEAATIYSQLLNEKTLPERDEEIMQRWTNALHLAGAYDDSDKACLAFQQRFGQSTLMPAVLFVYAENGYFRALAAEKNPNQAKELPKVFDEAVNRFQKVIDKYPEFAKVNVARYSLGLTLYRKGDLTAAQKILSDIPGPERSGELGMTSLMIADCVLRQVPNVVPDDALAAGKMEEQHKSAAEALEAFVAAQPKDPNTPDALIRLGLCQQRMAGLIAQPKERVIMYNAARSSYERLMRKEFPNAPLQMAQATFERAKCITQAGDINTGISELRKFTNDPLRATPVAPQALLQLATYLRTLNRTAEAVDLFAKNRDFLEGQLAKEQTKGSALTAMLRYHHGVALREVGKLPEARAMFETVVKLGGQRPEMAEAALRIGQCLKDEGFARLETARKMRSGVRKPEEIAKVQAVANEGYKYMRDAVTYLEGQSDQLKANQSLQDVRGRMLYEAAWGSRVLAEPEIESARAAIALEMQKKLNPPSAKFPLPEVALDKVPLQPSEKKARSLYKTLIDQAGELPIATEARFELAELLAQRNEYDAAVQLLNDVLDKEPAPDLTEKIRLCMGGIQAAKGNLKGALTQFDAVASNPKSQLFGWAQYRAGEALIQNQQYSDAIKRLVIFRDQPAWQNVPGLSDRAMLRLGYAYSLVKALNESRNAYERVVNAFPNSQWNDEARYGAGWTFQEQKNFDAAVNAYSPIVTRTATELAAKAQLQIGLCRMEQKRYLDAANAFLVIPTTYDYPELRAAALLEAGKAYEMLNQRDNAVRQFERLVREFPGTPWADAAKEKLGQKK